MATDHHRSAHEVLGLDEDATQADIRAAYLRLAKKYHPDKNLGDKVSEWVFREIQDAYEFLRDSNDIHSFGKTLETFNDNSNKRSHDRSARYANRGTRRSRRDYSGSTGRGKSSSFGKYSHTKKTRVRSNCQKCGSFASELTSLPHVLRLVFFVGEVLVVVFKRTVVRLLITLLILTIVVGMARDAWISFLEPTIPSAEVSIFGIILEVAGIAAILLSIGCFLKWFYGVWNCMALPFASLMLWIASEEASIGLRVAASLLILPFSVSVLRTYWAYECPSRCESCGRIPFEKGHNSKHEK